MAKTKEEILATKNWSSEYPNYMAESEIIDAMDEYAKQTILSFGNWALNNAYIKEHYWYLYDSNYDTYTTDELYLEYIKSIEK